MSKGKFTEEKLMILLDKAYESSINGIPGFDSAIDLANNYLYKSKNSEDAIESLINWQIAKCTTSGFLTGLGGVITLPVAIPANIASVVYVQIRMIAAIAYIKGYDVKDDRVKAMIFMCLCGNGMREIATEVGIKLGEKIAKQTIKNISSKAIKEINKKVGFKLLTKCGEKGIINLTKLIPLVGGVIGGGIDAISTKSIAESTKFAFA
jgi:uncharacterized protein (DUF697 family)